MLISKPRREVINMEADNLLTIRQLVKLYKAFTEATVRWWVFNSELNKFNTCIIRIGKRVYIDRKAFDKWLEGHRVVPVT